MVDGQAGVGLDIRFSHVAIDVSDVDRSLEFYRYVLGMDVVFDHPLSGVPFAGRAAGGLDVDGLRMLFTTIEFPDQPRTPAEMHRGGES